MASLWIAAALIAAAAQTARNAAQTGLTKVIGTLGATQVRFLFGLPFAIVFLGLVVVITGQPVPHLSLPVLGFTALGSAAQIMATALMLRLMLQRSFAVTTAWLKTEPVLVALVAALVLGDPLTLPMLVAIAISTVGVVLMTRKPGQQGLLAEGGPVALGLLAALLFGLSAIGFRGGITRLEGGDFLIRATTVLVLSLMLQAATLAVWLALFDRAALRASFAVWPRSLFAGFLGALASQFWFIGFALTSAANIRTLALVEVIFAALVSRYWFRQTVSKRQLLGMAVIVAGIVLLLRLQV